jgi:hypothetical protein
MMARPDGAERGAVELCELTLVRTRRRRSVTARAANRDPARGPTLFNSASRENRPADLHRHFSLPGSPVP